MKGKAELTKEVIEKLEKVQDLLSSLVNWEKDIGEEIKSRRREKEREIEVAKRVRENSVGRKEEEEKVFDEQIKAIDEALKRIEDISKVVPQS